LRRTDFSRARKKTGRSVDFAAEACYQHQGGLKNPGARRSIVQGPLSGFRVVEVGMWVAGPSSAAVLGDWGADVIKLEDPKGGDPIRGATTRATWNSELRVRPGWELDNRNKRSVAVDLRGPEGRNFALRIIDQADVFVTNLRLDALARMGLDYPVLSARNPRLVYATLNGYGHKGPDRLRPAFDYAAAWARSGLMATVTEPGNPPPAQRPGMIDHAAGLGLAGAISAALLSRAKTGRGQEVRLSLFAMGLWMNATDLTVAMLAGQAPQPESRKERVNPLWNSYQCKDGRWIYFVMIQSDRHWPDFCTALEHGDWRADPRFADFQGRMRNSRALTAAIEELIATRTLEEWAPIFDRHGLFWAPVNTNAQVLNDPQAHAIEAFVPIEHPQVPNCRVVRSPIEFSAVEGAYAAAPELGQHTEEVAREVGVSWEEIAHLKEIGALG
jgi:crotonobetainyl-CoA:carnitine CoA-transferase CaiB-like acyl-CoA transferase